LVDINHSVTPYNISQAAFVFKNAYHWFPKGSLHIILVNLEDTGCHRLIAFQHLGHFFIVPDNGIYSLIFDELPKELFGLALHQEDRFSWIDPLTKFVGAFTRNTPFHEIAPSVVEPIQKTTLHPITNAQFIRGTIIHIDNFENVIVNIHRELFEKIRAGRNFGIHYKRWEPISQISACYQDVQVGEILANFNSSNYLEIAVNLGKAASLLGLHIDDTIQVDFYD